MIGFAVDVTDAAPGIVKAVNLIYRDCNGTWRTSNFAPSGGNRWSGGGPVAPSSCTNIDYYLQAVDNAGNVAVSSKKLQLEPLLPPVSSPDITASLSGTQHTSGWYKGPVTVSFCSPPAPGPCSYTDGRIEYSLDGGAFQTYTNPFVVSGDGVHVAEGRTEGGATRTVAFGIDTKAPIVLMTTPAPNEVFTLNQVVKAAFVCADAGSGPATCNGSPVQNGGQLQTSTPGQKTITVTGADVAANAISPPFTRNYSVVYDFTGFFDPVKNLPVLNEQSAVNAVPFKFGLGGNQGLQIFATGYPKSQQIACNFTGVVDGNSNASAQSFKYIASLNQYEWVWKTDKAWAGTCRQFVMKLKDNTFHRANFRFK